MQQPTFVIRNGNLYSLVESLNGTEWPLHPAIYNLEFNQETGISLKLLYPKFDLNFKLYDLDKAFIDHAIKRYESIDHSMGILLNGVKGTGRKIFLHLFTWF